MKIHVILVTTLLQVQMAFANNLDYFKDDYDQNDRAFVELFSKIKKTNRSASIHQFQYSAGTLRTYFFPAQKTQKNLLVMISGTHGVEGLAGSAIQRWFLEQDFDLSTTAVLMVHGLNIYGFKNFRRTDENNIDLNRNFILSRSFFSPDDSSYEKLNSFLNPTEPPTLNILSRISFIFKSIYNIVLHSLETLRSSILKGQYSFQKGLFYGGEKNEVQSYLLHDLVSTYMKPYKKIFIIDLHTGYGEKGKLHLFAGNSTERNSQNLLKVFKKEDINFADNKKFYRTEGDVVTYFIDKIRLNIDAEVSGTVFEYGTMNTQTTLGSIESLRRMVLENQNYFYPGDSKTSSEIRNLYLEMFYPSDPNWRNGIIEQTRPRIIQVMDYFNKN